MIGQTGYSSNPGVPWPATDELGRSLAERHQAGSPRPNRFVGIFYFLWVGQHERTNANPVIVDDVLRRDPAALEHLGSLPWGPAKSPHYWGEPLFGFYLDSDPWVLRRHAQLLADAGIDTLIFDTTNAQTYHQVYLALCRVFHQMRQEGQRTPQIAFMVNTEAGETAHEVYEDFYSRDESSDLWFRWNGKPLLVCDPERATPEVRSFFTLRRAHWPFTQVNTENAWHWEGAYPQVYGFTQDARVLEQVSVSVAQNLRASDGKVTAMSNGDARGRSFHNGSEDRAQDAVKYGYNFQEQWGRAHQLDPPFVFVTGWNEWIAGRFTDKSGRVQFVDQFNEEFSRDIEPMKGGHGDNYYLQLIDNVRKFKGMPNLRKPSEPKTIHLDDGFYQWRDVQPEYLDGTGEVLPRDFDGVGTFHYANKSGRNDLQLMKVARDEQFLYFYAQTLQPISPRRGWNWMTLLIDIDANPKTGWHGYDFVVNRQAAGNGKATIEKNGAMRTGSAYRMFCARQQVRKFSLRSLKHHLGCQPKMQSQQDSTLSGQTISSIRTM